jgi:flavin-dependent dehydrogenase
MIRKTYDAIVIGARCAGAPTAMLLARKGYKILLVDRAAFPSDIPHGHYIHRMGPRYLARWGLLDRVTATNCPAVTTMTWDAGDFPLVGKDLIADGVALGYGPRRSVLDKVLVDAAVEAGVELRTSFTVDGFTTDGDRVTGIRGRARADGAVVTERAAIVIGADGRHSRLAAFVGAPEYHVAPRVTCWYWSYWSGVPDRGAEVYVGKDNALFCFPTNDGLFGIFIAWRIECFHAVRANIEQHFMAAVDAIPGLSERVRNGHREERFAGCADLPNFFRKPYGLGWALVGDAGLHKDPFLALGISDAFRDAELLAAVLDACFTYRRPLYGGLAEYESRRNEATTADFHENLAAARFLPLPEEVSRLRAALRGNQEATNQFFRARQDLIPKEAFFNPENLESLMNVKC